MSNPNNLNVTINIPIPIGWDEFIENIEIKKGNANYEVEKTIFGDSLKISCKETIEIVAYTKLNKPFGFSNLSMINDEQTISHIFLNSTDLIDNISIILELYYNVYYPDYASEIGFIIDSDLELGWNEEKIIDTHGD